MNEVKCQLTEVFDSSFIELLQVAPANPVVRGLVLRMTGKQPAPECQTFDQVKEWAEMNCARRRYANDADRVPGIDIEVTFAEVEYGRAHYKVYRSGTEDFNLGADELVDMVREAVADGQGMRGVIDRITRLIREEAWDRCEPCLDGDDYEYYDHEALDSDSQETEYVRATVREQVLGFVRGLHPELAAELEG